MSADYQATLEAFGPGGAIEREHLVALEVPEVQAVTVGEQGPPGRNGVDGATISPDQDNQIQNRPNGLYVPPAEWVGADW
ncbi:hypothetical protein DFO61_3367 [Ectopseudomonas oleovorans]|uniref:Uncharacterized protein n=1 Tax=Ectopseudomonas oleovorans TaxID=301 RepID=A0A397MIU1_ECTOL|nr:hypothetical protein [Pseudomonas oleovorans]RIA22677.1 hypothetical protein DFO61_3367 [Pseudomonas oleovorans]